MSTNPDIFQYLDYRKYLQDYHNSKREKNPGFSVRAFLKKAGIASPSFFRQIVNGERNLTTDTIRKVLSAMQLSSEEEKFFRALVGFDQATDSEQKQLYYESLQNLGKKLKIRILGEDTWDYYKKWYLPALRELAVLPVLRGDPAVIAKALTPSISTNDAKKGLAFLLDRGFLQKTESGAFEQSDRVVHTGDQVQSMAVRHFNRQMLQMAEQALDSIPVNERNIRGVTMGISAQTYERIVSEIDTFHNRIMKLVAEDSSAERIFQLNTMIFPLSEEIPNTMESPANPENKQ